MRVLDVLENPAEPNIKLLAGRKGAATPEMNSGSWLRGAYQ
jgi:hypothetical protein